ncbi:MAG: HesA/MoeB/ThiF family protein [Candidatus Margulisbacteria bacterium]|nr:HesA/MoeB/ThiF family protein [Candidatus Margulisiibacteriota bacterium]
MKLSENQLKRYSKHLLLDNFGLQKQSILLNSRVLIIGVGGLGSAAAFYLASSGVGTIGLVDADMVSLSNLQRQIIHSSTDLKKLKVESAKEKLLNLNPDLKIIPYPVFFNKKNCANLVNDFNFIIDATDNFETKFLINSTCVSLKKAFSHAGVAEFSGQTMTIIPGKSACYQCVFQELPKTGKAQPDTGVLATVPGIIGLIQATEAIKYLTGTGKLLTNKLLTFDALTSSFRKIDVKRISSCKICVS